MSPQLKEIVMAPHLPNTQHLGPDARQRFFHFALWRLVVVVPANSGSGNALRSTLPFGFSGKLSSTTIAEGIM